LITSKELFAEIKCETRQIYVEYDEQFLEKFFGRRIHPKTIKNQSEQLIFKVYSIKTARDIEFLSSWPAFKLTVGHSAIDRSGELSDWQNVFAKKRHLELSVWSWSGSGKLSSLQEVESWKIQGSFTSINSFKQLKKLELLCCRDIQEFNCFKDLEELHIICNREVSDISALGNIRKLVIDSCDNITDISALSSTHYLKVTECGNINKVPLTMKAASFVSDLSGSILGNVQYTGLTNLTTCDPVIARNQFGNLFSVMLFGSAVVKSLPNEFKTIPVVTIEHCSDLTDISSLGGNKVVFIRKCYKINSYSSLRFIPKVTLDKCNIGNDAGVDNVRHLILRDCSQLKDINGLARVHHLELSSWKVKRFDVLYRIPIVEFGYFARPEQDGTPPWGGWKEVNPPNYLKVLGKKHEKIVFPHSTFPNYKNVSEFPSFPSYQATSEHYQTQTIVSLMQKSGTDVSEVSDFDDSDDDPWKGVEFVLF
jgi:hypothetical protein